MTEVPYMMPGRKPATKKISRTQADQATRADAPGGPGQQGGDPRLIGEKYDHPELAALRAWHHPHKRSDEETCAVGTSSEKNYIGIIQLFVGIPHLIKIKSNEGFKIFTKLLIICHTFKKYYTSTKSMQGQEKSSELLNLLHI